MASGETKVIGTGKPAANDASFTVPKGYTQELDGSVTGPEENRGQTLRDPRFFLRKIKKLELLKKPA